MGCLAVSESTGWRRGEPQSSAISTAPAKTQKEEEKVLENLTVMLWDCSMMLTKGFGENRGAIPLGTVQTVLSSHDSNIMVSGPPLRIYRPSKYPMKTYSSCKCRLTLHVGRLGQYFEWTLLEQLASDMEYREMVCVDRVDLSPVRKEGFQESFLTTIFLFYFLGNEGLMLVCTHPTLHFLSDLSIWQSSELFLNRCILCVCTWISHIWHSDHNILKFAVRVDTSLLLYSH